VQSCIIDGEMIAWDTLTNKMVSKGASVDVKSIGLPNGNVLHKDVREIFFSCATIVVGLPV
jgi:hypothetical protein